ncbi:SDR family NAD(P)-dependent oxidoreductase [Nesterenkonia alkaliphila]|uniref:SDR family oxidoreductase n=1 Tax=Nesterenkonia alkaliphila TaxID=1463631 RepID=A0A7K1UF63_9MICC|nr:SDR family oxidoreductase [Nesterenkonia alkaliphila]MVT25098.1 SDR family oxidoreductase [Nesterenkonia alkaliphila]GFZ82946.1 oxidoreductase [Nesterenkonia alkaliphila]
MDEQRTALVTGASSGIGSAIARRLVHDGARVLVGYHSGRARAEQLCDTLNTSDVDQAVPIHIDLTDPQSIPGRFDELTTIHGPIHHLVNNAGINDRSPALALDHVRLEEVIAVNLSSPLLLSSAAARYFVANNVGGSIVTVTSVHDQIPITGGALYCASKGGLAVASRALALEFAEHGIRLNLVAPGETATPMNGIPHGADNEIVERPAIPMRRAGQPAEIANTVAWLLSPEASYMTGATLYVDGGLMLTAAEENAKAAPHTGHFLERSLS